MNWVTSFWVWLDGKKTAIATIFWSVTMPCLNIIYPNGIPSTLNKTTLVIGTILSALGIGHKIAKNFQSNEEVPVQQTVEQPVVEQGSENAPAEDKKNC